MLAPLTLALCLAAPPRLYVVAVGNNAVPLAGGEGTVALQYADDDAARVFGLYREVAKESYLLSVLDPESQGLFPEETSLALAPTLAEFVRVFQHLAERLAQDRAQGQSGDVLLFFSGHGVATPQPSLTFLDGALTRDMLFEELLPSLPARYVHLILDACHAEALVHGRGAEASATIVDVPPGQGANFASDRALARFPQVGVVVATSATHQAHEWQAWRAGVFTHQVLSGLRGGADANGDRVIEYRELHAFLAAANGAVRHPQARLHVVVEPPALNTRAALMDLHDLVYAGWVSGVPAGAGHFAIETRHGVRVVDLNPEPGQVPQLAVPADTELLLRVGAYEAPLSVPTQATASLVGLALTESPLRGRGVAESLREGLFATPYGPAYFRGFADRPVEAPMTLTRRRASASRLESWVALGVGSACGVAGVLTGAVAWRARQDYQQTSFERRAYELRARYDNFRYAAFGSASCALVGWAAGYWLWPAASGSAE